MIKSPKRQLSHEKVENHIEPVFKENYIPIVLATDNNYASYLAVCLQSIIDHANKSKNYDLIILIDWLSEYYQKKLLSMTTSHPNISVRFYDMQGYIKKYNCNKYMTSSHIKTSAYYRLFVTEIFKNYSKILYLDCDTVVLTDLIELYETDLKDNYAAVVEDLLITHVLLKDQTFASYMRNVLNIKDLRYHFNSGVMLFNLDFMRKNKIFPEMLKTASVNTQYFHDQNVLNAVFYKKVIYLDGRYNVNYHLSFDEGSSEFPKEIWDKYLSWLQNPKILHYTSRLKPWQNPSLPLSEYFWQYARKTPFYEEIFYNNLRNLESNEFLRDIIKFPKFRFDYYRCRLLANFAWGERKKHYKEKKRMLYQKIKRVKKFLKGK